MERRYVQKCCIAHSDRHGKNWQKQLKGLLGREGDTEQGCPSRDQWKTESLTSMPFPLLIQFKLPDHKTGKMPQLDMPTRNKAEIKQNSHTKGIKNRLSVQLECPVSLFTGRQQSESLEENRSRIIWHTKTRGMELSPQQMLQDKVSPFFI